MNGRQTADGLDVYLVEVPAAVTLAHQPSHEERRMHGGGGRSIHDVHLLVADFDRAKGENLRENGVTVRLHRTDAKQWTVPLRLMTINGTLAFGGFTTLGAEEDLMISFEIVRSNERPRHGGRRSSSNAGTTDREVSAWARAAALGYVHRGAARLPPRNAAAP